MGPAQILPLARGRDRPCHGRQSGPSSQSCRVGPPRRGCVPGPQVRCSLSGWCARRPEPPGALCGPLSSLLTHMLLLPSDVTYRLRDKIITNSRRQPHHIKPGRTLAVLLGVSGAASRPRLEAPCCARWYTFWFLARASGFGVQQLVQEDCPPWGKSSRDFIPS